jgi:predicted TIM-barrel fold metal-dependent hydrolase
VHDGMRVLDADAHVVEPGDVFAGLRFDDAIELPPTTPFEMVGDTGKLADFLADGASAREYLRCMDAEGIDAAVLYPSIGLFAPFGPGVSAADSAAACRAYNEWIADYSATDPARLAGIGLLPLADVDAAIAEVSHAAALGLPGVMARPNPLAGRMLGDRAYDPLYEAIVDAGLTLSVHEGLGLRGGSTIGMDRSELFAFRHALSHPMEQMSAMASLMLEGALERHPQLRVAFLESGTGWLVWWLARLDEHAEWMEASETKELSLRPSGYFARQCIISSDPEDPLCAWTVEHVGADHVVWASDFPHPDAKYPEALATFVSESAGRGLPSHALPAILWDTPLAFYGLAPRFAPAA